VEPPPPPSGFIKGHGRTLAGRRPNCLQKYRFLFAPCRLHDPSPRGLRELDNSIPSDHTPSPYDPSSEFFTVSPRLRPIESGPRAGLLGVHVFGTVGEACRRKPSSSLFHPLARGRGKRFLCGVEATCPVPTPFFPHPVCYVVTCLGSLPPIVTVGKVS